MGTKPGARANLKMSGMKRSRLLNLDEVFAENGTEKNQKPKMHGIRKGRPIPPPRRSSLASSIIDAARGDIRIVLPPRRLILTNSTSETVRGGTGIVPPPRKSRIGNTGKAFSRSTKHQFKSKISGNNRGRITPPPRRSIVGKSKSEMAKCGVRLVSPKKNSCRANTFKAPMACLLTKQHFKSGSRGNIHDRSRFCSIAKSRDGSNVMKAVARSAKNNISLPIPSDTRSLNQDCSHRSIVATNPLDSKQYLATPHVRELLVLRLHNNRMVKDNGKTHAAKAKAAKLFEILGKQLRVFDSNQGHFPLDLDDSKYDGLENDIDVQGLLPTRNVKIHLKYFQDEVDKLKAAKSKVGNANKSTPDKQSHFSVTDSVKPMYNLNVAVKEGFQIGSGYYYEETSRNYEGTFLQNDFYEVEMEAKYGPEWKIENMNSHGAEENNTVSVSTTQRRNRKIWEKVLGKITRDMQIHVGLPNTMMSSEWTKETDKENYIVKHGLEGDAEAVSTNAKMPSKHRD